MKDRIYSSLSEDLIGKEVTLTGRAAESKPGPCLQLDNDIVFIKGKRFWPEDQLNKKIIITGRLSYEKMIPDVVIDENGGISQGATGKQYILENITEIKLE